MNNPVDSLDYSTALRLPDLSRKAKTFIADIWVSRPGNETVSGLKTFILQGERGFKEMVRRYGPYGVYGGQTYAELAAWAAGEPTNIEANKRKASVLGATTVLLNLGVITDGEAKELRSRHV